jgi:di/tripeptidase
MTKHWISNDEAVLIAEVRRLRLQVEAYENAMKEGQVAEDAAIVEHAVAVSRMLGIEPRLGRSSTDANIPISLGIPAITIGGGGVGGQAHSLNEYFINRDGTLGLRRALLILLAQAGVAVAS